MQDPFTGEIVQHPETGAPIEIFDATRSINPDAYTLRSRPLSGSFTKAHGNRLVEVGTFQTNFPAITRRGVRCVCPHCNHLHIYGPRG
jgi:uncharacterized Zn-binding protein involved in type VI secretion